MPTQPTVAHLIFKTHLDLGFTDLARNVVDTYMTRFIPRALDLAAELRQHGGPERFIWTTGAWLIYEFLERAGSADRGRMEAAIAAGDIAWHGLPFTTHSELMDQSLFAFGLSLSHTLDQRFGKTTIAAKMTDVPGHTRAIVPLLAQAGIQFLHIGVNPASTPPDVPPVFVWRNGAYDLIVMYTRGSYGDLSVVPDFDAALAFAHTGDNLGPPTADQVIAQYAALRTALPGAEIKASTLDAFAARIETIKQQLPVITSEIGDTWIHGVGSDPLKVSQFRALSRLRSEWIRSGRVRADDPLLAAFSRRLLLIPEHTWGMDEKTHLPEYTSYTPDQIECVRGQAPFEAFAASWTEQRNYVNEAIAALGSTALGKEATATIAELSAPHRAATYSMEAVAPTTLIETRYFCLGFDPVTGAITQLIDQTTGRAWVSPDHPLALISYEMFTHADYKRFWQHYIINKRATRAWSWLDYTKPGIHAYGSEHQTWHPTLHALATARDATAHYIRVDLAVPQPNASRSGCPAHWTLWITLPDADRSLHLDLQWRNKRASRLPEAVWLSFNPIAFAPDGWQLHKMGEWIAPHAVVRNGNRTLHAVDCGVRYADDRGQFALQTLDAPLVAPGERSLLRFRNQQPRMQNGVHVNLYNNVWGTNFPMWYDDDARFRFTLQLS